MVQIRFYGTDYFVPTPKGFKNIWCVQNFLDPYSKYVKKKYA